VLFKCQRYRVTVGCKPSIRAVVHFSSLSFRSLSCLSSATIRARSTAPDVIECNTAPETTPTKYISTGIPIRFTISTPSWYLTFQWSIDGKLVGSINVRTAPGQVILAYKRHSNDELWQNMEDPVSITWTACHYGGTRPWFICPALGCYRRVAILYIGVGVACRHCLHLAYESQRESPCNAQRTCFYPFL